MIRSFFLLILLFIIIQPVSAQQEYAVVRELTFYGNHKTKEQVIRRELDMLEGDTLIIAQLPQQIVLNERRLLSTKLFTDVNILIRNWDTLNYIVDVHIELVEGWYFIPTVVFELADRNFNVWWKEMGGSLSRVNYGVRADHFNLTGYRDRLKVKAQFGFTRNFVLEYRYPFLSDNWGFQSEIFYADNKEIDYITLGNKQNFISNDDERLLLKRFRTGFSLHHRPDLFAFHTLRFQFQYNQIDDFIAKDLNPNYFLNGNNFLRYFMIEYDFQLDKRVFTIYPEGGYMLFFNIKKEGLGIFNDYNNLPVFIGAEKHLGYKRWIVSGRFKAKANLIRDQVAFVNNKAIGYGHDVITGYELYVIDGTDFVLFQTALKFRIFDKVLDLGKSMPLRQFRRMSVRLFLRWNFDGGYINERDYINTNILNNRWVLGYGPAIDFMLWNTFVIEAAYSFNQLGESGFFFKSSLSF